MKINPKALDTLLKAVQAADPTHHGWRIVEDVIGVDPWLLCEWIREGANAPIYQLDSGGHTAWGFTSQAYGGFLVADTVNDEPYICTGDLGDFTRRIAAALGADAPWLTVPDDRVCGQTILEAL